jgi:hypothetical protein
MMHAPIQPVDGRGAVGTSLTYWHSDIQRRATLNVVLLIRKENR